MSAKKKTRKRRRYDNSVIAYIRRHLGGMGDAAERVAADRAAECAQELPKRARLDILTAATVQQLVKTFATDAPAPAGATLPAAEAPASESSNAEDKERPRRALPDIDWNACPGCGSRIIVNAKPHLELPSWRYCCDCHLTYDLKTLLQMN